jgi:hypothetical protein
MSSCGTSNNFLRQKFTNLSKIKTDKESINPEDEVSNTWLIEVDESDLILSSSSNADLKNEDDLKVDERNEIEPNDRKKDNLGEKPSIIYSDSPKIHSTIRDDGDEEDEDDKSEIDWFLLIYIFFFAVALGFFITSIVLFFDWVAASFILAALGPAAIFATVAAGLFLILLIIGAIAGGNFGPIASISKFGLYISFLIPVVYTLVFILS